MLDIKHILFFLIIFGTSLDLFGQFSNPYINTKIVFKNGDRLSGEGKTKKKGFKFKEYLKKPYYISFSDIEYVKQYIKGENKTYFFFETTIHYNYIKVEKLKVGSNTQLYAQIYDTTTSTVGGWNMPETVVSYYIKKTSDTKLTYLGPYNPLGNNLKDKVLRYFSDCPELIEKINNKDYRMRDGLEPIFNFYIENCEIKDVSE